MWYILHSEMKHYFPGAAVFLNTEKKLTLKTEEKKLQ